MLRGEKATRSAVLAKLGRHSTWHFSCHGGVSWRDPLLSGLLLAHDETLTVRDLLETKPERVKLAVLSACQTSMPGLELPHELLGLPAALLQFGVEAVVSSMWPVYDASTMMLMSRFYSLWRRADSSGEAMPGHTALRLAQLWVRDTTNREKAELFRADIPELRQESARMAAEAARAGFAWARMHDPDERSFADPYHWAAFHYTG